MIVHVHGAMWFFAVRFVSVGCLERLMRLSVIDVLLRGFIANRLYLCGVGGCHSEYEKGA
jgi:hypothetical protein